jgi:hydrogenase expression/formation protein HypC
VPGRVEQVWDDDGTRMGLVDFGGVRREVCLAYVPEVEVGDYTIVHVGFALTRLDEDAARETLALFAELGRFDDGPGVQDGEAPSAPAGGDPG